MVLVSFILFLLYLNDVFLMILKCFCKWSLKTLTHQTDNIEHAATKIGCSVVFCPPLSGQTLRTHQLVANRLVRAAPAPSQIPFYGYINRCYDEAAFFETSLNNVATSNC